MGGTMIQSARDKNYPPRNVPKHIDTIFIFYILDTIDFQNICLA